MNDNNNLWPGPFSEGVGGNLNSDRPKHWETSDDQCAEVQARLREPENKPSNQENES